MSAFLTSTEMEELTGIKTGRGGKSKLERQIDQLRVMRVPFLTNAAGRPIVARAYFDCAAPKAGWEPRRQHA